MRMIGKLMAIAVAVLAFAAAPAMADETQTYSGTVGTSPVVVYLESNDDGVSGQYFYNRTGFDIPLTGAWRGDTLTLESRTTEDKLALHRIADGLSGTLTTKAGRRFVVTLSQASAPASNPGFPEGLTEYQRLRLASLTLTPGEQQTIGGRTIRWYSEARSGTRLFRIESGYPKAVLMRVNAALTQTQWSHIDWWFGCPGWDGGSGVENDTASAPYLGDTIISYRWNASWGCAGTAHPDFGIEGHSYSAGTGAELELDDLLRFGDGDVPAAQTSAWYGYRSETFGPGVVALLERHYPDAMRVPEDDDGCDYTDADVWNFPAWYATQQGLYLGASFARVMRACDNPEWSVIPWQALNGPAAPQGVDS